MEVVDGSDGPPMAVPTLGMARLDAPDLPRLSEFPWSGAGGAEPTMEGRVQDLLQDLRYHVVILRRTWTPRHWGVLALGLGAFLLGSVDVTGELWSGGDPFDVGLAGAAAWRGPAVAQVILSGLLWLTFAAQLWTLFPTVRDHLLYLLGSWMLAYVGWIGLFGTGGGLGWATWMLSAFFIVFIATIFRRAVAETRDLHVEQRHHDPDPRVMHAVARDHSLAGWLFVLLTWQVTVVLSAFGGTAYVETRPHGELIWLLLHLVAGVGAVWGVMHLLWFPQLMLGGEGGVVQTDASRKVAAMAKGEAPDAERGTCPSCEARQPIWRDEGGLVQIACAVEDCEGHGPAGAACDTCETPIATRHECTACGVSAPALDFLPDLEAW